MAGATPACTATPTLGASGTIGTLALGNATSGTVTLGTVAGALGSVTASLPANTGTIAELNLAQSWAAKQTFPGGDLFLGGVNAQTGTTYTVVAGDANKLVTYSNALAIAVTLPQATTTGFGAGAFFPQNNLGVGTVTITPTTSTINGAATLVLTTSQDATIYSDGTNYFATVDSGTGNTVTGGSCTNQVATAIAAVTGVPTCASVVNADIANSTIDLTAKVTGLLPQANISLVNLPTPGATCTFTAPATICVATTTATITVPVPAAGQQFCVMNDDNVSTVITLSAIGSSARYENTARTAYGTAGTGTLVSGGAVGDMVCIVGRDSTHYLTVSHTGTWTAN